MFGLAETIISVCAVMIIKLLRDTYDLKDKLQSRRNYAKTLEQDRSYYRAKHATESLRSYGFMIRMIRETVSAEELDDEEKVANVKEFIDML